MCCCGNGEGRIVGVGGPEGRGVVSRVLLLFTPPSQRELGARTEASRRTVRWCARVAAAFKLRKNRYCTTIGARQRKVFASEGDFSMRAQVK